MLLIACATAIAVALTVAPPQLAHADRVTPSPVPSNIEVPAGNKAFFVGYADGTQNYICLPCPNATAMCPDTSEFAWILFGPQATLFNDNDKQVITHFLSPNPSPDDPLGSGTPRATWQHSRDTSAVWAFATPATTSTDPDFVAPGAIPWLLLQVVGAQDGPDGGDKLSEATFIQRLNTGGGRAPSTGCASPDDVGKRAFVPYTADYFFYKADH
jgi:hypothetical protein